MGRVFPECGNTLQLANSLIIRPITSARDRTIDTGVDDLEQWSRFWDQGFITTFGDSKPNNYDGVVAEFWHEKFVELPNDARILDIAAGNGAIATMAARIGLDENKNFFVAATDLARIHPELIGDERTLEARARIDFHGRTPCEKQPFEDHSFDLVTSQFGFEYSDIDATLREVRRVLKKDGRFVAISHHADSKLIVAARLERDIYEMAMDDLDLIGHSRRYFEELGELPDDHAGIAALHRKFRPHAEKVNALVHQFQSRYGDNECAQFIVGTLGFIASTAKNTTQAERLEALDKARSDFEHHRARLADMVEAALDSDDAERLTALARSIGFTSAHCLKIYDGDSGLAGWQIHLA